MKFYGNIKETGHSELQYFFICSTVIILSKAFPAFDQTV